MKHHEYQIYYGGFKIKLKKMVYCIDCDLVRSTGCLPERHYMDKIVRSHKKQTDKPRYSKMKKEIYSQGGKYELPKKN